MSEIDGVVEVRRDGDVRLISVTNAETFEQVYELPEGLELQVAEGDLVDADAVLASGGEGGQGGNGASQLPSTMVQAAMPGRVEFVRERGRRRPTALKVISEETDAREYPIPATARVRVESGELVRAGHQLTEGYLNPQDVLAIRGPDEAARYLVDEVQRVYRSQGVNINDRHIEVIVRQMLRKVQVEEPGDTDLLSSEIVDRWVYEDKNARAIAEGGEPATVTPVLLGVTKASLSTDSFLAAASFQETTRVLTDAAMAGRTDYLRGLKENVIIGKLIPARAPILVERPTPIAEIAMPESLLLPFLFEFEREQRLLDEESAFVLADADKVPELAASFVAEPD